MSNGKRIQIEVPTLDLLTLHQQLCTVLEADVPRPERLMQWLQILLGLTNAAGAVYAEHSGDGWTLNPSILSKQALSWHPQLEELLQNSITSACEQQQVQMQPLDEAQSRWIIATPVLQAQRCDGMALVLWIGEQPKAMFVTVLQLLAGYCLEQHSSAKPLQQVLSILQTFLVEPLPSVAYPQLLSALKTRLDCQRLVLGRRKGRHCRLQIASEQHEVRRQADLVHTLESLMDSTLQAGEILTSKSHRQLPALAKVLNLTNSQSLCSVPLYPQAGQPAQGVLICWWSAAGKAEHLVFLQSLQTPLGTALNVYQRAKPSVWQQLRSRWQQVQRPWQRLLLASVPLLLISILLLPVNHSVSGTVEVVPAVRRFVTAPFDGILKYAARSPGDVVAQDTVLGRLDEREIELSLQSLQADSERAAKQRDASRAKRDTAAVQMASLEIERLQAQIALLEQRLAHLDLQSPVAGMVISEDLKRAEGSPVTLGQSLFEIAPLDNMIIELAVPAEEIAYLQTGLSMRIHLDAYPYQSWQQPITLIQPQAQIRNVDNVFILEAHLANDNQQLRPGMRGQGRVVVGRRALGWVYFHPLWEAVLRWLR